MSFCLVYLQADGGQGLISIVPCPLGRPLPGPAGCFSMAERHCRSSVPVGMVRRLGPLLRSVPDSLAYGNGYGCAIGGGSIRGV